MLIKMKILNKIKSYTTECKRVLKITKKPNTIEFKTIVKVSGMGMILIGLIGFLIQVIKTTLIP